MLFRSNLSVWLVSLPWSDGAPITDNLITRGWADPQNHSSLTEGRPLVPGELYDVAFDLQPDDQIIPAGQRIGLMIFSSDRDFTLWPEPGTELTLGEDVVATALEGLRAPCRPGSRQLRAGQHPLPSPPAPGPPAMVLRPTDLICPG